MYFSLTYSELNPQDHISRVTDPSCGAISSFIGTVRDSFQNQPVLHLDYSAYDKMVTKEMSKIFSEIQSKFPRVKHLSIEHRLGIVKPGEASIIIATSSPDRASSIQATTYTIESIKSRVPIWKKEVGVNWESWKANTEWQTS